jgi:integrase
MKDATRHRGVELWLVLVRSRGCARQRFNAWTGAKSISRRGHIEVKAAKAKSARRRIVPIQQNLAAWLRPYSGLTGHVVPESARGKCGRVRKTAKLARWPKNGLRHSYSSYRLAAIHDAPRVASELGHTNSQMLFSTYRELVKPEEVERYWKIEPKAKAANVVSFGSSS